MEDVSHSPPHNLEIEKSLLGCLIRDNKLGDAGNMGVNDFYCDKHQIIFRTIQDIKSADFALLVNHLEQNKLLEDVGGRSYLMNLVNNAGMASSMSQYAEELKDMNLKREMRIAGQRIEQLSRSDTSSEHLLAEVTSLVGVLSGVTTEGMKVFTITEIMKMEDEPDQFVVDKIIPKGSITSITADSGKGKSVLAMILMKHMALGEDFCGLGVAKSRVWLIDQEQSGSIVRGRCKAIFQQEIDGACIFGSFLKIDGEEDYRKIKKAIVDGRYDVVIFDTFSTIHTGDENSSRDMSMVSKKLLQLITETGVTIIYLHHHRKQMRGESYNQSTSRGSTEIIAKVASHLLIEVKKELDEGGGMVQKMTISQEKSRSAECISKIGLDIKYDSATKKTSWCHREVDDIKQALKAAKEFVLSSTHEKGEATIKELLAIKKERGLSFGENAVRRACKELINEELLVFRFGESTQHGTKFYMLKQ